MWTPVSISNDQWSIKGRWLSSWVPDEKWSANHSGLWASHVQIYKAMPIITGRGLVEWTTSTWLGYYSKPTSCSLATITSCGIGTEDELLMVQDGSTLTITGSRPLAETIIRIRSWNFPKPKAKTCQGLLIRREHTGEETVPKGRSRNNSPEGNDKIRTSGVTLEVAEEI